MNFIKIEFETYRGTGQVKQHVQEAEW